MILSKEISISKHFLITWIRTWSHFIVQVISADFHGKTSYLEESMKVGTIIAGKALVHFGYGAHPRSPDADNIQNRPSPHGVQLGQVWCFRPNVKYFYQNFLDY